MFFAFEKEKHDMKKHVFLLLIAVLLLGISSTAFAQENTSLQVTSNISGADVYLDGVLYEQAVTPCSVPVTPGEHTVKVCVAGYRDYEERFSVTSGIRKINAVLAADIPSGDRVRTIVVSRSNDDGFAYAQYFNWDNYDRFINKKLGDWPRDDSHWIDGYAYDIFTHYGEDKTGVTLRQAITIVMNDTSYYDEANQIRWHYVIKFADGITSCTINEKDIICYGRGYAQYADGARLGGNDLQKFDIENSDGDFTINGDKDGDGIADVTLCGASSSWGWDGQNDLHIMCSNVNIHGLKFAPTAHVAFGMPFGQPLFYADVENISITACDFSSTADSVGRFFTHYYGTIGHGCTKKRDYGTYDLKNFSISNCSFDTEQFGIIVACGDIDYASLTGLTIQANRFKNGYIFVRNVDGHTWYMWESNGGFSGWPDSIGVAEHNELKNVIVSGNYLEWTKDVLEKWPPFDGGYGGVFAFGNSNLGGSYNTSDNILVRCNTSRLEQGFIDAFESFPNGNLRISNASVGDKTGAAELCEVSHNTLTNVEVAYNDYELCCADITNMDVGLDPQTGTDNTFDGFSFHDNTIKSVKGLKVAEISGTSHLDAVTSGDFTNISIKDNTFTALKKTGWSADSRDNKSGEFEDSGINIYGASVANYDDYNWDKMGSETPLKIAGGMKTVTIEKNVITGYSRGISVIGASCDRSYYAKGINVDTVLIKGNEITTDNLNENCYNDAIVIVGAREGGNECSVSHITVDGNTANSLIGLVAAGFMHTDMKTRANISDNIVSDLVIKNNMFTQVKSCEKCGVGVGILCADILMKWNDISIDSGLSRVDVSEYSNNIYTGFDAEELLLSNFSKGQKSIAGATKVPDNINAYIAEQYKSLLGDTPRDRIVEWYDLTAAPRYEGDEFRAGTTPNTFGTYAIEIVNRFGESNWRFGNYHRIFLCFDVQDVVEPLIFGTPSAKLENNKVKWNVDTIENGSAKVFMAVYENGRMITMFSDTVTEAHTGGEFNVSAYPNAQYGLFFVDSGFISLSEKLVLHH